MRSKMIFDMPWMDYNRLIETHGNFAFTGWVTLILLALMVFEFRGIPAHKPVYFWLLSGMVICSWGTLFSTPFAVGHKFSEYISFVYMLLTYIFSAKFISDILKSKIDKVVALLAISAITCLVLSSVGTIMLGYLFATKSLNAILYRDALFGYLHLQYNGFFSLATFAIIFNKLNFRASSQAKVNMYRFAILLCISVIPSMFITFLWHATNNIFHIMSIIGSVFLLLSFWWLLICARSLRKEFISLHPVIRLVIFISISFFAVKLFLQSLTITRSINILVFGNRSVIMGFLHLVFLGFVTLFIIAYIAQKGFLNVRKPFIKFAIIFLTIAVVLNEAILMTQGLGDMFIISSSLLPWLLWIVGILLLTGAIQIAISRAISK